MTLFMNRYLVVIGGESPVEHPDREPPNAIKESSPGKGKGERSNTIEEKRRGKADGSEEKASYCSE